MKKVRWRAWVCVRADRAHDRVRIFESLLPHVPPKPGLVLAGVTLMVILLKDLFLGEQRRLPTVLSRSPLPVISNLGVLLLVTLQW